ncbi:MAG: DUF1542 domain-containing protein, partial [Myxococcota bacterium]
MRRDFSRLLGLYAAAVVIAGGCNCGTFDAQYDKICEMADAGECGADAGADDSGTGGGGITPMGGGVGGGDTLVGGGPGGG